MRTTYNLFPTVKQYIVSLVFAIFTGVVWGFIAGFITHWALSP